jgi:hypothetical protein
VLPPPPPLLPLLSVRPEPLDEGPRTVWVTVVFGEELEPELPELRVDPLVAWVGCEVVLDGADSLGFEAGAEDGVDGVVTGVGTDGVDGNSTSGTITGSEIGGPPSSSSPVAAKAVAAPSAKSSDARATRKTPPCRVFFHRGCRSRGECIDLDEYSSPGLKEKGLSPPSNREIWALLGSNQ